MLISHIKIYVDTKKVEVIPISDAKLFGITNDPSCIVIDDTLHIFTYHCDEDGENVTNLYVKYHTKTGKITKDILSIDKHLEFGDGDSIVHIPSKQKILFTGGDLENVLLEYDIKHDRFLVIENIKF